MLGLVVPIFQKKYIKSCVSSVLHQTRQTDIALCIVNDGQAELVPWLDAIKWSPNVHVLHLSENRCFAGANNAGWEHLLHRYPSIEYLGTLNDDTRCRPGCMDYLLESLERHPGAGMVSVVQHIPTGLFKPKESLATWRLGSRKEPGMVLQERSIDTDSLVPVLAGVCMVAHAQKLIDIGMFDTRYVNSCEDVDLSLSMRKNGWDLYVCANAHLVHYASKSRFKKNANPDMWKSLDHLFSKWGEDLSVYNNLRFFTEK